MSCTGEWPNQKFAVSCNQTAFFLLYLDEKKGSGTMTKDFLPSSTGWAMIGDNDNF